MSSYTNLGSCIWEWEPFVQLDATARILWLALYTTAEAKRIVPGLFHGSITAMAEAAKLPVDETLKALDSLLDHEMAEFDQKHRVLRLTVLPDGKESPPNGNVIRGWFKRFKTVPACQVRDAHVSTLAWLMNEWSRDSGKPISQAHRDAWGETFAHIVVPPPRRRGVRKLSDSSTGTHAQPGLFDPPSSASSAADDASGESASDADETVSGGGVRRPDARSVDSWGSDPLSKKINNSETVPEPFRNGSDQDQDPDPDLDLSFFSRGSGADGSDDRGSDRGTVAASGATGTEDRDRERRPWLTLVPMPTPESPPESPLRTLTPEDLVKRLSALSAYRPVLIRDEATQNALCATIAALVAAGWGDAELDRVAQHVAHAGIGVPAAERWFHLADWAARPGNVLRALTDAHEQERKSAKSVAELAEFKKQLGYPT